MKKTRPSQAFPDLRLRVADCGLDIEEGARDAWEEARRTLFAASDPPQFTRSRMVGKTVPKTFDLQAATPFLPCVLGCTLFESATEGRIRAFYTVGTSRRSTSASIVNYGLSQALTWCLKWAWQTHSEHTGESCPWPELLERVCEPLP